MKYKTILVTRRGGPEVLRVVERDLRPPLPGEARIKVLACPVAADDVAVRIGNRPFPAKVPFVPGYSIVGNVAAVGDQVSAVIPGERVAALVNFGGWAEYIYWPAEKLVRVPETLDPAQAALLILNYLVAYQVLHRVAQVRPGSSALIIGAGGGCGTAFLQLGRLAGLKMYGLASSGKHAAVRLEGAVALDYHDPQWTQFLLRLQPGGLDFVFNGMDEMYFEPGLSVLRRGGVLVHYGGPLSTYRLFVLVAKLIACNLRPDGKTIKGYGTHRVDIGLMKEDWTTLFEMLAARTISPVIARKFPLLEARQANEFFERGGFTGSIILVAPDSSGVEPDFAD